MGSKIGVVKLAARRVGLSVDHYLAKLASGEKWCTRCKAWHPLAAFGKDAARSDGLSAICGEAKNAKDRDSYTPTPPPKPGRKYVPRRDGDKKQARERVNYLVRMGLLPKPGSVACADCGHLGPEVRHEYDHHLGYGIDHQEIVQAVCAPCHHRREKHRTSAH